MPLPPRFRRLSSLACLAFLFAAPASAQAQAPAPRQQVVSANPFGILLGVFNIEYERKVAAPSTLGIGGSYLSEDDLDYLNVDVFYRYYPSQRPMDGLAFGVKVGVTNVTDYGSFVGVGFDVNYSWLLGRNDGFYVGLGFGLKRLYGTPGEDEDPFDDVLKVIPTFRIVNIGVAF
jgi:hypothetical protein